MSTTQPDKRSADTLAMPNSPITEPRPLTQHQGITTTSCRFERDVWTTRYDFAAARVRADRRDQR